jgi:protein-disulfide isomerase/ketosteroid isomerase-like protein
MLNKAPALPIACLLAAAAPALADPQADIQYRYNALAKALTASNLPVVDDVLTSDFHGVDMEGQALSRERMIAAARPGGQPVQVEILVERVDVKGDTAAVYRTTAVPDATAEPGHDAAWVYSSRDIWKQAGGTWRLEFTRATWSGYYADSQISRQKNAALTVSPPDADPSMPDMSKGNPKAAVTVIEYGSVACPICAMVNETTMPAFFAKYVATGKVRYIYRPMETGNAVVARQGHVLAECAGKAKYFKVIDAIMRAQDEMDKGGPREQYVNAGPVLDRIGRDAGLSPARIKACLADPGALAAQDRRHEAYIDRDGAFGTPIFVVNGRQVDGSLRDPHLLDAAIEPLLK